MLARELAARAAALEGRLARAAYLTADKDWKGATAEYSAVLVLRPSHIDPYMEAAEFFADRKDIANLDRTIDAGSAVDSRDPRLGYYRGVSLVLHQTQLSTARELLNAYVANVPERSDYPSHLSATPFCRRASGW